jgi:hypothetical protein
MRRPCVLTLRPPTCHQIGRQPCNQGAKPSVCCRPTTHFQFTTALMTHRHRRSHERRCLPARPVSNTCFQLNPSISFTNGASTAPFLTHRRSMTAPFLTDRRARLPSHSLNPNCPPARSLSQPASSSAPPGSSFQIHPAITLWKYLRPPDPHSFPPCSRLLRPCRARAAYPSRPSTRPRLSDSYHHLAASSILDPPCPPSPQPKRAASPQ